MSVFFLAKNQKGSDTHAPSRTGTTGAFPSAAITEVMQESINHSNIRKKEVNIMELKHVIPNMEKTFGTLEYAGEGKTEQRRINGKMTALSHSFNLYSDVQRADDIVVILPAEAGEKHFDFEEKVKLTNPRITAEGYKSAIVDSQTTFSMPTTW